MGASKVTVVTPPTEENGPAVDVIVKACAGAIPAVAKATTAAPAVKPSLKVFRISLQPHFVSEKIHTRT
jgi:hypothetical protein